MAEQVLGDRKKTKFTKICKVQENCGNPSWSQRPEGTWHIQEEEDEEELSH